MTLLVALFESGKWHRNKCHFNCCTGLLKGGTKLEQAKLLKVTELAGLFKPELLYLQHGQNEPYPLFAWQPANRCIFLILNLSTAPAKTSGSRAAKVLFWPRKL